jgi:hypothetical protein
LKCIRIKGRHRDKIVKVQNPNSYHIRTMEAPMHFKPLDFILISKASGSQNSNRIPISIPLSLHIFTPRKDTEKGREERSPDRLRDWSLERRLDLAPEVRAILSPPGRQPKMSGRHDKEKGVNVQVLLRCR